MLYGKFTDKGDIPVNNPNIHNVEDWAYETRLIAKLS
jgi:hypothetical protein